MPKSCTCRTCCACPRKKRSGEHLVWRPLPGVPGDITTTNNNNNNDCSNSNNNNNNNTNRSSRLAATVRRGRRQRGEAQVLGAFGDARGACPPSRASRSLSLSLSLWHGGVFTVCSGPEQLGRVLRALDATSSAASFSAMRLKKASEVRSACSSLTCLLRGTKRTQVRSVTELAVGELGQKCQLSQKCWKALH